MSALGLMLIELAVRGSVVAALGILLVRVLGRLGPSVAAMAATVSLTGLAVVTALAPSPWPRWWSIDPGTALAAGPIGAGTPAVPGRPVVALPGPLRTDPAPDFIPARATDASPPGAAGGPMHEPLPPGDAGAVMAARWGWSSWLGAASVAGLALALGRWAGGLLAVSALRKRGRPVADEDLLAEIARLRAALGPMRPVQVRELDELTTPATIGWLQPMLLLPAGWRTWDDAERRAVLAHELAHIRRGDYAAGVWAGLCLALHFFNPLAYRLAARLRLQQELAADAWGAALSGGQQPYLATLARLALRRDERPARWPARAIFPGRYTFLRRLQMLRDAKDIRPRPSPAGARFLAIGVMAAVSLAAAGLRGPGGEPAMAQVAGGAGKAEAAGAAFDLSLVPPGTALMLAIKPSELLGRPEARPLLDALNDDAATKALGLSPERIEQATFLWFLDRARRPEVGGLPTPAAAIVRMAGPFDWKANAQALVPDPAPATFAGEGYLRSASVPDGPSLLVVDDRTAVLGRDSDLQTYISARKVGGPRGRDWDEAWEGIGRGQVGLAVSSVWILNQLQPTLSRPGSPAATELESFSPLWLKAHAHAASLDLGETLTLEVASACGTDEGAQQVARTLDAGITLARNSLAGLRAQARAAPATTPAPPVLTLAGLVGPLLDSARVEAQDRVVRLHARSEAGAGPVVGQVAAQIAKSRARAKQVRGANNLRQIGLAMHNYVAAHGTFPPAVLYGPDGKTPYSWRVAILPHLNQQALYDRYKFDEPWDGPNNRKLIAEMPAVYRFPDGAGEGMTSYFVPTGPQTMFTDKLGVRLQDIRDGLSNTIMAVEAKREVPWTKPEDIPYDPAKPLPALGGFDPAGFSVLFGDGAVRFLEHGLAEKDLRALFTSAGDEVISPDAPRPGGAPPGAPRP